MWRMQESYFQTTDLLNKSISIGILFDSTTEVAGVVVDVADFASLFELSNWSNIKEFDIDINTDDTVVSVSQK